MSDFISSLSPELQNLVLNNTSASTAATSTTQSAADMKNEFLTLLVTQLKNQDPLDPVKNQDFIAQLAQFNSLEQMMNLNTNSQQMLNIQQLGQAGGLIGKTVTWQDSTGASQSAVVAAIGIQDKAPILLMNDTGSSQVTMDQVLMIQ